MRVDPEAWGIEAGYHDIGGTWREPPQSTVRAVLDAMGAEGPIPPSGVPVWVVRTSDETVHLGGRWELHGEGGAYERVSGTMPVPPPGYYDLLNENDGRRVHLIVSPGTCHLPPDVRGWGWAVQLYATRSSASWGIGDFGDLRAVGEWARRQGASTLLVNPFHAPTPVVPIERSPYYASSRCFLSPLYVRIADVPGATELVDDLAPVVAAGRALNEHRQIDHDEVWRLKRAALELIWAGHARAGDAASRSGDAGTAAAADGELLTVFATFCAIAEQHGPDWRDWPEDYRHPQSPDVARYADANHDRVRFHVWLQGLLEDQLAAAARPIRLIHDLAIGIDPAGFDAWMWQDALASGLTVGAPPDDYNTQGQDWGFPPFDPWRLRAHQFEPFVQTIRAALRHGGSIRFDHVMGLFRLFWIPRGARPSAGVYVRYPWEELLDILALESMRAGGFVIGEDLGTVEPHVREELARRDVLSYRLLWFEGSPPSEYPERALAAVTTHDLPSIAGVWTGSDLARQRQLGMRPSEAGARAMRDKLRDLAGVADDASIDDVVVNTYRRLAEAKSVLVTATLDDVLAVEERPNYPGTVADTNWSLALPVPLEEIESDPRAQAVADALNSRGTGAAGNG